ncbi:hypothetical protein PC117_g5890 [Phytophthora cactorum]|nr:hypothetical protein PC117_g5890 [Phytophthora cactorum]KAG3023446.1 hypothetical protein PC120_g7568 [Phytophthora cactorum]
MVVAHQVAIALFLRKTVINTRTKVTVAETVALEIEAEITQGKVAGMVDEEDGSATTDFKGEVLGSPVLLSSSTYREILLSSVEFEP